jgi:hypothetical protein
MRNIAPGIPNARIAELDARAEGVVMSDYRSGNRVDAANKYVMHNDKAGSRRRTPLGRSCCNRDAQAANSMRLLVSPGFAISMAETTIVTRD